MRQVAVAGAAVYLAQLPALGLGAVVWAARREHLPFLFWFYGWLFYVLGVLALALVAAAWSGRRGLVAAGAAAAVIAAVSFTVIRQEWDLMVVLADFVGPPAAVFLRSSPGARSGRRCPCCGYRGWPWEWHRVARRHAPALFAAVTAGTTLLSPYTSGLSLVTVLVAVCWLATDVRPLASLVFAFTVSRVIYGFAYGRPLVTGGPTVIALVITASPAAACALVWLLRRRTRTSASTTS